MATDTPVEEDRADGGYAVTLVIRSSNEHHLQPPLELPDGIQAVVDGPEVVLTVPVRAPNAASALAAAKTTATDLLLVLASTFNGYEFVIDQRQLTRRTDAVYQAEDHHHRSTLRRAQSRRQGLNTWTRPASYAAGAG
jgi:hypothetical protein